MSACAGDAAGGAGQRTDAREASVLKLEEAVFRRIESVSPGAAYGHAHDLAVGLDNETFGHFNSWELPPVSLDQMAGDAARRHRRRDPRLLLAPVRARIRW